MNGGGENSEDEEEGQKKTDEGKEDGLEDSNYLAGYSSLSERCLGRRTTFYLKSESMVGRITRHRIQTLASVMGVSAKVHIDVSRKRVEEGPERFRYALAVNTFWGL